MLVSRQSFDQRVYCLQASKIYHVLTREVKDDEIVLILLDFPLFLFLFLFLCFFSSLQELQRSACISSCSSFVFYFLLQISFSVLISWRESINVCLLELYHTLSYFLCNMRALGRDWIELKSEQLHWAQLFVLINISQACGSKKLNSVVRFFMAWLRTAWCFHAIHRTKGKYTRLGQIRPSILSLWYLLVNLAM